MFVDFVAIFGKVLTAKRFAAKTRRIGYRFLAAGGVASLACNIASGLLHRSIGAAVYGAFIVGIVAALEYAVVNIKAKATKSTPTPQATPAKQSRSCPAGCTCGKHRKAARRPRAPKAAAVELEIAPAPEFEGDVEAELWEMRAGYVPANAPISPAA